jgi:glutamate/tyrosine decarboxylase-like PLP-dependent enzyme
MPDPAKAIPEHGIDKEALLDQMKQLRDEDVRWRENRAFSLVFHQTDAHTDFLKDVYGLFFEENGLNPMAFKSLRTFEHDVVRMAAHLFHGDTSTVGTMSSGGTESIMLAVRTYRDKARKEKPWIRQPEIIVPESVHVAFPKACKYFDVKMVLAPLAKNGQVDVAAVAQRISDNTIAIVGSAPNYPNGMIDPIPELGALAQERDVWLHVDACVGGFFLPWVEELGYTIPQWDFRVPGVTSISADLHKYGYAAKGASCILYRSAEFLRYQFYVYVDWPGGIFASPSMPGTRPGGSIAAAWAALQAMGRDGYLANAKLVMDTAEKLKAGVRAIEGLELVAEPPVGVFAYRSVDKQVNIFAVADQMQKRGWHIDRQQRPECLHLMINPGHAQIVDEYLADLRDAVAYVRANPDAALSGSAPAYGLMTKAPTRGIVASQVLQMMLEMYSADGTAPALGPADDDAPLAAPEGVPKPLFWAMKARARLARLFR